MEPEGRASDDERAARVARVEAMRARGDDPYPVRFDRTHTLGEVREHWDDRIETGSTSNDVVSVAGRVITRRVQGKLVFVTLRDGTGELQLFVSKAELGDDAFDRFGEEVERGDWVGVEGAVRPFVGKQGFIQKLANKIEDTIPVLKDRLAAKRPLTRIAETNMKRWPVGSLAFQLTSA